MSLTNALKVLIEKGYLKALDPQPLPDPLPARHNPTKYYVYHQRHGHGTDRCYRLRHEIQNLIDNQIIAPPQDPNVTTNPLPIHDRISPAHLNLIHILPSTFNHSIYITPTHLPKLEVFIPESIDLCMIDAPNPIQVCQGCQMGEPTTTEMLGMIENLQGTVTDLTFGVSIPSKSFPILGRATVEKGQPETISSLGNDRLTTNGPRFDIAIQSLGQAEASGKNKAGTSIDPCAQFRWAIKTLKVKGLNKQQVLAVVAKTVDYIFVAQDESILNYRANNEKGRFTRNTDPNSSPKPMNTRPTLATSFANISKPNASSSQK